MNIEKIRKDLLAKLQVDKELNTKEHTVVLGDNYMALINYGKHLKGLFPTLTEELSGYNVEIEQIWVKSGKGMAKVGGKTMPMRKIDVFFEEPIISFECVNAIIVAADNTDLLKYANKVSQRYLDTYSKVMKMEKDMFPKSELKLDAIEMCNKAQQVQLPAKPKRPKKRKTFIEKVRNKLVKIIKVILS